MERRKILFLERINPENYRVVGETENCTAETLRPPKTQIGISISGEELGRCPNLGLPTLRRCLSTHHAFPSTRNDPGCQFIALLQLKGDADPSLLHHATLEAALDLCETFDTN